MPKQFKRIIILGGFIPSIIIIVGVLLEPHLFKILITFLAFTLLITTVILYVYLHLKKRPVLIINLFLSFDIILFLLIVTELVFYFSFRDSSIGAADSPSGITFYPKYYTTNSFGFRDREFSLDKPANTKRILVLGDSFTFGMGLKDGKTAYPKVLERLLNQSSTQEKYDVINAGKKGYNTSQELYLLKKDGLVLSPDMVLLGYYLNDTEPSDLKISVLGKEPGFFKNIDKFLCQRFFSWYIIRTKKLPNFKKLNKDYNDYITSESVLRQHEKSFAEMVQLLENKQIPLFVVIIPPCCYQTGNNGFTEKSLAHIRKLSNKYNLPTLDLSPVMDDLSQKHPCKNLVAGKYDSHPSELVHEVYAQHIHSFLNESNNRF